MKSVLHIYEVRLRKDRHGFHLISDVLPLGRLWYDTPDNAIGYAMHSRSHNAGDSDYAAASNMMDTLRHKGDPPKRSSGKRRGRQCDGLSFFC